MDPDLFSQLPSEMNGKYFSSNSQIKKFNLKQTTKSDSQRKNYKILLRCIAVFNLPQCITVFNLLN